MGEGLEKVIVGCKKCKCNFIKCKMTSPIIKHSRAATLGTKKKYRECGAILTQLGKFTFTSIMKKQTIVIKAGFHKVSN